MIKRIVLVLGVLLVLVSCENLMQQNPVPEMRVEFSVNTRIDKDAAILDIPGGFMEVTKPLKYGQFVGYSGVLIFHTFENRMVAYDLCCPHEAKQDVRVKANMAGQAVCDSCKSVYDVGFSNGYPVSGPSKYPLRPYRVFPSGYDIHVTN